MNKIVDRINQLKKEKNVAIMAHYYVDDAVQDVADYIGDSFYLARVAEKLEQDIIVLCGVSFMGESAKILSPENKVLLPVPDADCPMAHMATVERIREVRTQYDDVAVVCYVNSTAELKAESDVCVTSANALAICSKLPNKNIFFIPDMNLAHHVAGKLPDKNFIFNEGYCPIHHSILAEDLKAAKELHKDALVAIHPECRADVLELADYIGSTSGIIDYVKDSEAEEFIIVTETGVMHKLKAENPDKKFYTVTNNQICPDMKKITLENVLEVMETETNQVSLSEELMDKALSPMQKMLELA